MTTLNDETLDFGNARLKLRSSLRVTLRQDGSFSTYVIEENLSGRFFQLGIPEYTFLTMLDGSRTVSSALAKCASLLPEHTIDESQAAILCQWAIESGLIQTESGESTERLLEQATKRDRQKILSWINPITLRLPLFRPDQTITVLTRYFGWLIHPIGGLCWLVIVIYGFLQLAVKWNDFYINRIQAFSLNDGIWIAISWLLLRTLHELGHAITCKRFGGHTGQFGILLLMFIPMPYVDVTAAWRFDNKWHRILTSAGGMAVELLVAAIACVVWAQSSPGPLQYHTGNLIISASAITLLFNLNPLMRFDGYYILTDVLETPNLASHGRKWLMGNLKWLYFGNRPNPIPDIGMRGIIVRIYGILALLWQFLVVMGLAFAAYSIFDGIGLILAGVGMVFWAGIPIARLLKYFIFGSNFDRPSRLRFLAAVLLTLALPILFVSYAPAPSVISAPIVIDYNELAVIRAKAAGFVDKIHVRNGEIVSKGDLLISLDNKELEYKLVALQVDIQIAELRKKWQLDRGEIGQVLMLQEELKSLHEQQDVLTNQVANLEVRAPRGGAVIQRNLETQSGRFIQLGEELLSIGDTGDIEAVALVNQKEADWIADQSDVPVELVVWGRNDRLTGDIRRIGPRARDDVPHEAFSASVGGELPVVNRAQTEDRKPNGTGNPVTDLQLTEPRVRVDICVHGSGQHDLYAGTTGHLLVRSRDEQLGDFILAKIRRLIRERIQRTHGL